MCGCCFCNLSSGDDLSHVQVLPFGQFNQTPWHTKPASSPLLFGDKQSAKLSCSTVPKYISLWTNIMISHRIAKCAFVHFFYMACPPHPRNVLLQFKICTDKVGVAKTGINWSSVLNLYFRFHAMACFGVLIFREV